MKDRYTIAIVEDEVLFRQGLTMLLEQDERMEVVLVADHGKDLLDKLATIDMLPDLLLCDLEMPYMDGVEVTRYMATHFAEVRVVILSSHYDSELILKMMEIGASAYMPKNEKPEEFYRTIANVIEDGHHYNDYVVQLIRDRMHYGQKKEANGSIKLTDRELEILRLICDQKTNKEIAELIYISVRTVEGHRKNLLEKTASKNTVGLIIYAIENGYFDVEIKSKWS